MDTVMTGSQCKTLSIVRWGPLHVRSTKATELEVNNKTLTKPQNMNVQKHFYLVLQVQCNIRSAV